MATDLHRALAPVLILALALPGTLVANPQGEAVKHGTVTFERVDGQLRVLQATDKAIIDWESFSIGSGELTQFVQPGVRSAALNRVRGPGASQIDGALRANGRVWLLNPAGIVVGPGGSVDAAGFVASTLDVSDGEFLSGGDVQFRGNSQAGVVNLGTISAFDGDVFLIAAAVENAGTIRAPKGTAGLAAGNDVLIRESGDERVFVRGASGSHGDGVKNTGSIEANVAELKAHGGNVYAMAIRNEGRVAATGVTREGGQIFLRAPGGRINTSGTLKARKSDRSGGRIVVDSTPGGTTEIEGTVDAGAEAGKGGEVLILGQEIQVMPGAVVIADGPTGGGSIFLGGGPRGESSDIPNAQNVTVASGAKLQANSLGNGPGGQIVVFAEDTLRFEGHASARGGPQGGNGGFVELSGKKHVFLPGLVGYVDVSAPFGQSGTLLFDPIGTTILEGSGTPIGGSPVSQNTLYSNDIETFLASANLIIETNAPGSGNGDIFIQDNVSISWNSSNSLTFNAFRAFNLGLGASVTSLGAGGITVNAGQAVRLLSGSSLSTNTGSLSLTANASGTAVGDVNGIYLYEASLNSVDGDITLLGHGGDDSGTSGHSGIWLESDSLISSTGTGAISLTGVGGTGYHANYGILIEGGSSISSNSGSILLDGTGSTVSTEGSNMGVKLSGASTILSDSGNITLEGQAGVGNNGYLTGVALLDAGTRVATEDGTITVTGTGGTYTDILNFGIYLNNAEIATGAGGGKISLTGDGGAGGVSLLNSTVTTDDGDIDVTATATVDNNAGFYLSFSEITAGTGKIHVEAAGSGTGNALSSMGASDFGGWGTVILESTRGDVQLSNTLNAEYLRLIDSSGTESVDFTVGSFLSDVHYLSAQGTGPHNAVGSVSFYDANGFTVAGDTPGIGIDAMGNVTLRSAATSTQAINIQGGISSQGGNIEIEGFDIDAANVAISTIGTGTLSLTAKESIAMQNVSVSVKEGALTMNANAAGTATTFGGIILEGTSLSSTDGSISLTGKGGMNFNGGVHSGIRTHSGSSITSTGTGAITLTGTAGPSGIDSRGLWIDNTSIETNFGALTLTGTGAATIGDGHGIFLENGTRVESEWGDITLMGTAGSGTGTLAGVAINDGGTQIFSENGNITLTGTGSSNDAIGNYGISVSLGSVQTGTGFGKISMVGSGGAGGVTIDGGSVLTGGGAIDLFGIAQAGNNVGVSLSSAQLMSGGGAVHVKGTGSGTGLAISTTGSTAIGSGTEFLILESLGGDVTAANAVQVDELRLRDGTGTNSVDFSLLHAQNDVNMISVSGSGSINGIGSVDFRDRDGFEVLSATEGAAFEATGNITLLSGPSSTEEIEIYSWMHSHGGNIAIGGYDITAFDVEISTTGSGTIDLTAARSIALDRVAVSVVDGDLTMNAHLNGSLTGNFVGIELSESSVTTSGIGDISLTGIGGNGATSLADGILLTNDSIIRSTSTDTDAGGISLRGTGGNGTASHAGVRISGEATSIDSAKGAIEIEGTAGNATVGHGVGVMVDGLALVRGENASVSITGTGGGIGSGNIGVLLDFGRVEAVGSGTVSITGQGGGGNDQSDGIRLRDNASVAVENGTLSMEGTAGPLLGKGIDVLSSAGAISVTGTGSMTLTGSGTNAAGLDLQGGAIGGANASSITITSTAGNVILSSSVTGAGDISLQSALALTVNAGVTSTAGDLLLQGNQITVNDVLSGGHIDFMIDDLGSSTSGTIAINEDFSSSTVQFSGGSGTADTLTFAGLSNAVTVYGADLEDLEFLVGSSSSQDHFLGEDTSSTYAISGPNAFSVGSLNVTSFEQLTGGADDDVFAMTGSSAFLTGLLDGGGGSNELSYTGYATGVVVDLAQGTATGLGTGFVNIGTFTGSAHVDTLTGPGTASTFEFSTLDTFTVNVGTQVYNFENVVGGPQGDVFRFLAGSGLSGYLNGGLGSTNNVLDYSLFGAPVTVNLGPSPQPPLPARYSATGLGKGFVNVTRFVGSASTNDTFIGPRTASTFNITGPDALNVGIFSGTGFENATGGQAADTFRMGASGSLRGRLDGGGGANTLDYSARGGGVTVDLGNGTATGLGSFRNVSKFVGTGGLDTLLGTPGGDIFNITANNAGTVGGQFQFQAFDVLDGVDGADVFNFLNQAQIGSVFGGNGADLLFLNDSNLRGTNTYTITNGSITRNPTYNFGSIETVRLLLGSGNDTVNSTFAGFVQFLDGGGGTNTLTIGGATPTGPSPATGGGGNINYSNFNTATTPPLDTGGILQLQVDQSLTQLNDPAGSDPFSVTNLFSTLNGQGINLNSLSNLQGGAFAVVLAGQAGGVLIDGNSYQLLNAFSLDGLGLTPSNFVLQALGTQLNVNANLELLQALGNLSGLILTLPDGALAIDLTGQPIPPPALASLVQQLQAAAGIELAQALQIPLAIILTPADNALTIDATGQAPPQAIIVVLTAQLDAASLAELNAALEIAPN